VLGLRRLVLVRRPRDPRRQSFRAALGQVAGRGQPAGVLIMAGHVVEVDESTLGLLIDGQLPWDDRHHIHSALKGPKRCHTYVKVLQSRVSWSDPIVLPLSPYLSIVKNTAGVYAVKCLCGHDFGDYRHNWKRSALMNVRDTQEKLQELWPGPRCPDPEKNEIR